MFSTDSCPPRFQHYYVFCFTFRFYPFGIGFTHFLLSLCIHCFLLLYFWCFGTTHRFLVSSHWAFTQIIPVSLCSITVSPCSSPSVEASFSGHLLWMRQWGCKDASDLGSASRAPTEGFCSPFQHTDLGSSWVTTLERTHV